MVSDYVLTTVLLQGIHLVIIKLSLDWHVVTGAGHIIIWETTFLSIARNFVKICLNASIYYA